MSKVQDVVRGLYFRKSKQEKLQQAIDRIESTQQDFARALERMEVEQQNSGRGIGRIESTQQNIAATQQDIAAAQQDIAAAQGNIAAAQQKIEVAQQDSERTLAQVGAETAQITELTRQLVKPQPSIEEAIASRIYESATAIEFEAEKSNLDLYRSWYDNKEFSSDWFSHNFGIWSQLLDTHGMEFKEGLEIGSFEGRSAVFLLEYLPKLRLTCVDLFRYTENFFPERMLSYSDFVGAARFDRNMSKYIGRYEKISASSFNALATMVANGKRFDFIYIDGSHLRDDVLVDAALSWKLLNLNGLMIFDDYQWRLERKSHDRPKDAIDYFVYSHIDEIKVLHMGWQCIIKKVNEIKLTPDGELKA